MAHYKPSHLVLHCLQKLLLSSVALKELKRHANTFCSRRHSIIFIVLREIKSCHFMADDSHEMASFDLFEKVIKTRHICKVHKYPYHLVFLPIWQHLDT